MRRNFSQILQSGPYAMVILFGWSGLSLADYSFTPLGDLPGGDFVSTALGVSDDGTHIAGFSRSPSTTAGEAEAMRWTAGTGMVSLGDLPGGFFNGEGLGVSGDGTTIVGYSGINPAPRIHGFRWTSEGGMQDLGDLPGGIDHSIANDASQDGSVIVGSSSSTFSTLLANDNEAFRWTSGGMVGLGDLPDGRNASGAYGVSEDGNIVVGFGYNSADNREAFRWTSGTGMIGLGELPGGAFFSWALDISDDGTAIIGISESGSGSEAFRWTSSGMVGLGDLPDGIFGSQALGVSANGSVIVGRASTPAGDEAFLWTQAYGMVNLRNYLLATGVTGLTGWTLRSAEDVSANGRTIVGFGTNPDGFAEGFIVTIPEPGGFALFLFGFVSLLSTRRVRRFFAKLQPQ